MWALQHSCEQPACPARAAARLAQAFRERCREKGLPLLLPSNSAVQSTERDGGEFKRAETRCRDEGQDSDGSALGYRAEGGRITSTAGL